MKERRAVARKARSSTRERRDGCVQTSELVLDLGYDSLLFAAWRNRYNKFEKPFMGEVEAALIATSLHSIDSVPRLCCLKKCLKKSGVDEFLRDTKAVHLA